MQNRKVTDNREERRFEMPLEDGQLCLINYVLSGDGQTVMLTHTKVPFDYTGRGYGSQLVAGTLKNIRERGMKVIPSCSFVAGYIRRNPEWEEIVATR